MPAVTRQGDSNTGHGAHPPVALVSGSPNVFVNSIPCGRNSDPYPPHTDGIDTHAGNISGGSSTVFVNSKPIARVGDSVSCGGSVAAGSPNVNAN